MPTFDFTDPSGQKYSVNGPDGATPEQAYAMLQQHLGSKKDTPSIGTGLARAFGTGVPILGGLLNKLDAGTDALLSYGLNPLFPKDQQLQGDIGERYQSALKTQEGMDKSFSEDHPGWQGVGEAAGGIASTVALAGTAPGAQLLGLTGKTLPAMMKGGAISGGLIGATDAEIRGEDPLAEGGLGVAAGALGPVAGRVVGEVAKPFMRARRAIADPAAEAASQVFDAVSRGTEGGHAPLGPDEIAGAVANDQPVKLMDFGGQPALRLARKAANFSPEAQDTLAKTIGQRFRTQGDRLSDWLGSKFNYPNADAQKEALDQVARTVNRPAYAKFYSDSAGGVWNEGLEQLSQAPVVQDAIRKAMVSAKNEAAKTGFTPPKNPFTSDESGRLVLKADENGNRMLPNGQFWDYVKRNLDKVGSRDAKDWSRILRDQIDSLHPSYSDARAGAAKFFGANDALEAGQNAVTLKMQNRDMRAGLAKMSPNEKQLFQDGFVDRYIQTIREAPDKRNVLDKIGSSDAARERLNMALGPDKAKELEAFLRVEDIMDRARTAMGNSTTAQQMGDMSSNLMDFTDPRKLLGKVFQGMVKAAGQGIDAKVAEEIAKLLTSSNGADITKAFKTIAGNKRLMGAIRNPDAALGAIAARGAAPALTINPGGAQ